MYLEVLGRPMIILDKHQAAVDLLEKRSANYSDRPKFIFYELLGWKPALTFLQYGKQFAKHRQIHQSYLGRHKVDDFKPMQALEARTLARNFIESAPENYEKLMSRFATGIITQIVAGHRITSPDDPYLRMSDMILETLSKTGPPGNSPLDFFPVLQHFPSWFPGAKHVGVVEAWKSSTQEIYDYPVRTVRQQKEAGEAAPSFILSYLEKMEEGDDEADLKGAAATMFAAGEMTTWSTLSVFLLAMILHPEWQMKAQREIDSVVGDQRLPEFDDRNNLPLVECIMQETFRWNPVNPLGVPHRAMEDDIYRGMLIPKGSLVFPSIKGMSLDETVYSDPTTFYPERFLPRPAGKGEPHFDNIVFGFGRRICTGEYVASNSLWIVITSILATCTISKAVDEKGNIIVPENIMSDGLASHPTDTRCAISPRSARSKALIMEAIG
ncbi:cytochrome P450 [Mycena maculata]|uniref:Cytochrome P450 n=1 Tax=Mycena maculata TaxID=230809 RepID=A0AAD7NGE7_9AGAR|nr:cytochrome P450 [Mycena maculata]